MNFGNAKVQALIVVVVAIAITGGIYFAVYRGMDETNEASRLSLEAKMRDNETLRPYEKNMSQLIADTEALKQQLERQKLIVPDEKEADQFMRLMQNTAMQSGIEIRRYTSKPTVAHEFYTEVPFDMELDGPYYSVLNFYERVAKLERIINVSNMAMGGLKAKDAGGFKRGYEYAPHESVAAKCVATTFFSRDPKSPAAPAKR
jgi:type IV pilus assembly protein PilO